MLCVSAKNIIVIVILIALMGGVALFLNTAIETVQQTGGFEPQTTVSVRVDKEQYNLGETVKITVKNEGESNAEFFSASLGLTIRDDKNVVVYVFVGAQVLTTLRPGEMREFEWDQKDGKGEAVEPGIYTASVSFTDERGVQGRASVEIRIS